MLGVALTLAVAPLTLAGATDNIVPPQPHAEQDAPRLSMEEVIVLVQQYGFSDIEKIEQERDSYEVRARNLKGELMEIDIDAWSGAIVNWEYEE